MNDGLLAIMDIEADLVAARKRGYNNRSLSPQKIDRIRDMSSRVIGTQEEADVVVSFALEYGSINIAASAWLDRYVLGAGLGLTTFSSEKLCECVGNLESIVVADLFTEIASGNRVAAAPLLDLDVADFVKEGLSRGASWGDSAAAFERERFMTDELIVHLLACSGRIADVVMCADIEDDLVVRAGASMTPRAVEAIGAVLFKNTRYAQALAKGILSQGRPLCAGEVTSLFRGSGWAGRTVGEEYCVSILDGADVESRYLHLMWSISGASAASPQISHIERYCDSIAEAISRGEFVPVQECGPGLWPRASEEYRRVLVSKVAGAGRLIAMTNPHSLTAEWIFAELDASPEPELARELLNLHETSTLENVLETVSLVAAVS